MRSQTDYNRGFCCQCGKRVRLSNNPIHGTNNRFTVIGQIKRGSRQGKHVCKTGAEENFHQRKRLETPRFKRPDKGYRKRNKLVRTIKSLFLLQGDSMINTQRKLQTLAEVEGYADPMDLAEENITDSVTPGICMNPECSYTCQVEPDCNDGYCEVCETQTVSSLMILLGVI